MLTDSNKRLNGNLIPIIKLSKGALSGGKFKTRLTGYHIEALAVEIFQNYNGDLTYRAMLENFFDKSSEIIKKPIVEVSGQSQYVDDYLGKSGSKEREDVSREIKRISDLMKNADKRLSVADWLKVWEE